MNMNSTHSGDKRPLLGMFTVDVLDNVSDLHCCVTQEPMHRVKDRVLKLCDVCYAKYCTSLKTGTGFNSTCSITPMLG